MVRRRKRPQALPHRVARPHGASTRIDYDDFPSEWLKNRRRLTILLPPGYDHCQDHYPVFYLQDGQNLFEDHEAAFGVSWRAGVTAERLIPHEEIRKDPSRTIIPYYCVDAVCHVPYGSYPGNMPYEYFSDEEHLGEWLASDADVTTLQPFLQKYIYGTKDFSEYLELCGGEERLLQLRDLELLHKAGPHPSGM